ncbi:DUF541 domain-containing protein [Alkaliphilus pronyensis]|uniref:DUF541 domain-containing protein n=1 Tax=Alkaliphilus pronyensis TaxID=1482732 RepID=A0A6I0FA55_9FIRM|nr:SIMPL domain-containing protein [Alkaliphilus pronyensis]KAB3539035.1 DUF541 domain-containing protein [Alkaliphilus pronyensis]
MKNLTVKKGPFIILMVLLLVSIFFLGGFSSSVAKEEINTDSKSEISVSGTGVIQVKPDIGIINIAIETLNVDSEAAQDENTELSNKLVDALAKEGIAEEDIKTSYYNMYRERIYNKENGKEQDGKYRVLHSFQVTVKDINKVGAIIDTAVNNGANKINNIRFAVSEPEKYYLDALAAAVENAEGKAKTIANTLGVKIHKPSMVVERGYSEPYGKHVNFRMEVASDSIATPITAGDLEIKAYVNVTYNY